MTCPAWCEGQHTTGREHVSREARHNGMILELIQYFDEPEAYVSILEEREGGDQVLVPLSIVPDLPAKVAELLP